MKSLGFGGLRVERFGIKKFRAPRSGHVEFPLGTVACRDRAAIAAVFGRPGSREGLNPLSLNRGGSRA